MQKYTRIDNIQRENNSIWTLAKMLKHSGGELDERELESLANALMGISSKIQTYCYDLQPDEFDKQKEVNQKINNIAEVLKAAKEFQKQGIEK